MVWNFNGTVMFFLWIVRLTEFFSCDVSALLAQFNAPRLRTMLLDANIYVYVVRLINTIRDMQAMKIILVGSWKSMGTLSVLHSDRFEKFRWFLNNAWSELWKNRKKCLRLSNFISIIFITQFIHCAKIKTNSQVHRNVTSVELRSTYPPTDNLVSFGDASHTKTLVTVVILLNMYLDLCVLVLRLVFYLLLHIFVVVLLSLHVLLKLWLLVNGLAILLFWKRVYCDIFGTGISTYFIVNCKDMYHDLSSKGNHIDKFVRPDSNAMRYYCEASMNFFWWIPGSLTLKRLVRSKTVNIPMF